MVRALVCPGQGAQSIGMGKSLAEEYSTAKAVFEEVDEALHPNVARNDAINKANAMKRAKEREASKPSPDVIAARKRQYSGKGYTTADKKKVIGSYKEHHEKDADGKVIEHEEKEELNEGKMPEGLKNYLMKKNGKKEDKKEEMKKESVDLFDIVKGKLIDEGCEEKEALKLLSLIHI